MNRINFKCLAVTLLALLAIPCAQAKKKVHTIGDSTMQTYSESDTKRGWGQMLQQFFDTDNITVNNRGKSGASSKSFYLESAYWPTLVSGNSKMQPGDILVIQFAHNDEKSNGTDGDEENAYHTAMGDGKSVDYRGTTPFGTYKDMLRHYIDEAKAMGVKPVLCGPICRKYFSGKTIRRNGRHDLGDNFNKLENGVLTTGNSLPASDHTMDYVWQMQQVALEYDDVPFIDLTTATAEMYLSYGEAYCTSNLFCPDDNTHPGPMGATLIARLFAQLVRQQAEGGEPDPLRRAVLEELNEDIVLSSEISFSPTSGDLGKTYTGQTLVREFNVSAFGMTPSAGSVTFTVEGSGLSISPDKSSYSQSFTVDYTGSTLITQIYVKAVATGSSAISGKLTATNGNVTTILPLSAEVVSLAGGEEVCVAWPLVTDAEPIVTGPVTPLAETWSQMYATGYSAINSKAVWPEESGYDATHKTQRNGIVGDKWPAGEIDEVSTRYIQFAVQCPDETDINIDRISMYVAGAGGSGMRCKIYYSTHSDFSDPQQIYANTSMAGNTAYLVESAPAFKISEGERLYLRVYPWYNGEATGKTICLSDVTIHGFATKAGGEQVDIDGTIVYALHDGGIDQTPEFTPAELGAGFAGRKISAGSLLTVEGTTKWTGSDDAVMMTKILNNSGSSFPSTATDDNTLVFTLTPEDGFFFLPSSISFNAARFGTDSGTITAVVEAGSAKQEICSAEGVNRGAKDLTLKNISAEIAGVVASSSDPLLVKVSFLGLGNTKNMGVSDLVIEGHLQGAASSSVKYVLNTSVTPVGAGTIALEPELGSYKEGTSVKLTAERNFGYAFTEWQDAEGKTISTESEISITMDSDKSVVAVFNQLAVYSVSAVCTNKANLPLGEVTITPNDNEGKFEAGTEITVVAKESPIAVFNKWTDSYENAEASAIRRLTVDSDMELVAEYDVHDFIAVFDASKTNTYAYETTGSYPFPADIAWDAERNASCKVVRLSDGSKLWTKEGGTPVVRNREGVVLTTINGLYQNGFDTRQIAFEYEFSTKGFTTATFTADMAAKNMASSNWKVQISTDGASFTDLDGEGARWAVSASVSKPVCFDIPAEYMNIDRVAVRITADGESLLSSTYTVEGQWLGVDYYTHSESGIGNVYITGTSDDTNGMGSDIVVDECETVYPVGTYTLDGRKVSHKVKGQFYIENGKKIIY